MYLDLDFGGGGKHQHLVGVAFEQGADVFLDIGFAGLDLDRYCDLFCTAQLKAVLERNGYAVKTHENPELHGLSDANICNRGRRGVGIQLELSSGLRQTFFQSLTDKGRKKPTDELVRFAEAVRKGLHTAGRI